MNNGIRFWIKEHIVISLNYGISSFGYVLKLFRIALNNNKTFFIFVKSCTNNFSNTTQNRKQYDLPGFFGTLTLKR